VAASREAVSTKKMAAIDFRELLKAERNKARKQRELTQTAKTVPMNPKHVKEKTVACENCNETFGELFSPRPLLSCEEYKVGSDVLDSVFYIPNWISSEEESRLMQSVYNSKSWVSLRNRRLQQWGGHMDSRGKWVPESLPRNIECLCNALVDCGLFDADGRPNHALVNAYERGQGILPHTDGPKYAPRTATLSLSSPCLMTFYPYLAPNEVGIRNAGATMQLVLQPRSLVVFCEVRSILALA
jgi:alkylated DNA repair protein alkB family protein 6